MFHNGKKGHVKINCTSKEAICTFCSGDHNRDNCSSKIPKCLTCKGKHPTTSRNCPLRKEKIEWLERQQKRKVENEWNIKIGKSPLRTKACAIFRNAVQKSINKAVEDIC